MSQEADLKRLARQTYVSYHQDGLIDLAVGWATLFWGLNLALDESGLTFMSILGVLSYVPLKNRITVPRLGYARSGARYGGRARMTAALVALALLTAGTLVFLALGMAGQLTPGPSTPAALLWIGDHPLSFYAAVAAVGFGLGGLITGIRRLFVYALLSLCLLLGGQLLGARQFVPVLLLGGIILGAGIALLVRFLRKYPAPAEEEDHDTR